MTKKFKLGKGVASFTDATMEIALPNVEGFVEIATGSMTRTTRDAIKNHILEEVEEPTEELEISEPEISTTIVTEPPIPLAAGDEDDEELSKSEMLDALKEALPKDAYKKIKDSSVEDITAAYKNLQK